MSNRNDVATILRLLQAGDLQLDQLLDVISQAAHHAESNLAAAIAHAKGRGENTNELDRYNKALWGISATAEMVQSALRGRCGLNSDD